MKLHFRIILPTPLDWCPTFHFDKNFSTKSIIDIGQRLKALVNCMHFDLCIFNHDQMKYSDYLQTFKHSTFINDTFEPLKFGKWTLDWPLPDTTEFRSEHGASGSVAAIHFNDGTDEAGAEQTQFADANATVFFVRRILKILTKTKCYFQKVS